MTVAIPETGVITAENGRSFEVQNGTELPSALILESPGVREIANELSRWADNARSAAGRTSLFDRGAYAAPDNVYEQIKIAHRALENDDVVGGVAEVTEGIAFQTITWETDDPDVSDVFNQLAEDLDLDSVIRRMWREEFAVSQVYGATWWGRRSYTVRGRMPPEIDPLTGEPVKDQPPGTAVVPAGKKPGKKKKGNKRRRTFDMVCPVAITIFDPGKIVPCGMLAFGQETLCYRASRDEMESWRQLNRPDYVGPGDTFMQTLFTGEYTPSRGEAAELVKLGVDPARLLACDPRYVWRHTSTKSDYERFAPVRLKSTFRLLDLKQQMLEADRVLLIGAANYILLVKKGEKDTPAQQTEIDNLNTNFKYVAKLPVIVSDHRLSIEIVAPKTDFTLDGDRYDTIDMRLMRRLLGAMGGSKGDSRQGNQASDIGGRATARSMENRRHMLARTLEKMVARAVVDHPLNTGLFDERPNLAYQPRHIEMDVNAAIVSAIQAARTNGEISRQTYLEELGFDQAVEAQRRENEDEQYPGLFKPIAVPFSSPDLTGDGSGQTALPRGGPGGGNGGGRPTGGGKSPQNTTQAGRSTSNGNPSTGGKA